MKTFFVRYGYAPDMVERRKPHREGHLAHLQRAKDEGRLHLAGPLQDPVDGSVIIIDAEGPADVHAWIAQDPYSAAGLIRSVEVREMALFGRS